MTRTISLYLVLLVAFGFTTSLWAEKLEIAPSETAVSQTSEEGITTCAFVFDISVIPENGRIDEARLEWSLFGVSDADASLFAARGILATWSNAEEVSLAEEVLGDCEISPLDFSRTGGLVRIPVDALVQQWMLSDSTNHGMAIETGDLSRASLLSQVEDVRLILIYAVETQVIADTTSSQD